MRLQNWNKILVAEKRWRACKNKSACNENLEQQGKDEQQWSVFVGFFAISFGWF